MRKLLIIGGTPAFVKKLMPVLGKQYHVDIAKTGREGLDLLESAGPSVVLLAGRLPDMNGLDILKRAGSDFSAVKIILFTADEDMAITIQAMKHGAFDCVQESIAPQTMAQKIQKAIRVLNLTKKIKPVPRLKHSSWEGDVIIGQTPAMREIYQFIGRISNTNASVGIRGETGTGKELVARVIHQNSANREQPFITVDCSTIVETLSESTLYGHEKGSFTGAIESRPGQFEIAGQGTIFLDEIAEIPLTLQAKLLRFLQEKEYQPVGSRRTRKSNARIIVATNRDLYKAILGGKFRKDLYYRLKVLTIFIPPLRERTEDIPLLIQHFLHKIDGTHQTGVLKIEDRAVQVLMEYDWPGNIRELENLLTLASVLVREEVILEETVKSILNKSQRVPLDRPPVPTLAEAEETAIRKALAFTKGNHSQAAELLKISRPTLRAKIKKYGLNS